MYDTVKLWHDTLENDGLESVLSGYKARVDPKTGDFWQYGDLNGLRVRSGNRGLFIEGSLAKYHFGNNLEYLTREATEEAIRSISDRLHISIEQARVLRLDVAQNFIMQRPVVDYLSCLLAAPHYKRTDFSDRETVNFQNTLRILCFYDKTRELEKKKQAIPEPFKGKNILRYEARFLSRLGKQFGMNAIYAGNLSDEIFFRKPVNKWQEQYFLIQKIKKEGAINMTGQKEFIQSLASYGLQSIGGADVALDLIKGARLRGEIGKKTGQRLRKLTLVIAQGKVGIESPVDECIEELDAKVREAAQF